MPQDIDMKAVKEIRRQTTGKIQSAKLLAARNALKLQQNEGNMPDEKFITSYVTSTNVGNRYNNLGTFFRVMAAKPDKYWQKKFIFKNSDLADYKKIAEATQWANEQILARTPKASQSNVQGHPGFLRGSIKTLVDGKVTASPGSEISKERGVAPVVEITNFAAYASTAEARSFFSAQAGIIYYVAQRLQTRYPELGILFYYAKAEAFGLDHIYDVPVLLISSPENATGKWSKPGVRARARLKTVRRLNRVFK